MPYLFNGKELDSETGLYYYGARYYDPKVSIFVNIEITKFLILSLIMEKIRKLNPVK